MRASRFFILNVYEFLSFIMSIDRNAVNETLVKAT